MRGFLEANLHSLEPFADASRRAWNIFLVDNVPNPVTPRIIVVL